jgi:ABC-type transport system involved in Fe-S cluster assembly fused permease/ATPase subunit
VITVNAKTMITSKDLKQLFHFDTGKIFDKYEEEYYQWVEERFLEKLNKDEEFNEFLNEINLLDGE